MTPKIAEAFARAQEIKSLMIELLEVLEEIKKDESISVQARHLVLSQVYGHFSKEHDVLKKSADEFMEETFVPIKTPSIDVHGFDVEGFHVAGRVYKYTPPKDSVEILNKDDKSWHFIVKTLVENNMTHVIQKRLNAAEFTGSKGPMLMEKLAGLVGVITKDSGSWSTTNPKKPKRM